MFNISDSSTLFFLHYYKRERGSGEARKVHYVEVKGQNIHAQRHKPKNNKSKLYTCNGLRLFFPF